MQPTLFDTVPIEEQIEKLLPEFVRIALDLKKRGFKRYSADGIGHLLRYFTAVNGGGTFKINNNTISTLARRAMQEYAELDGFFETRRLKS